MERDAEASRRSGLRNPLNVTTEKIEETRFRLHGDISASGLTESDRATEETDGDENSIINVKQGAPVGNSCEKSQEDLSGRDLASRSWSSESDTTLLGLSENVEWVRRNFKKPLALAMRDILARKPSDPVDFLVSWLMNYRSLQEKFMLRQEQDRELMEERMKIQQLLAELSSKDEKDAAIKKSRSDEDEYEWEEGIVDSNFEIYID